MKHQLTSPWLTAPPESLAALKKILGRSYYKAFAGCCTWLNGVYWIKVLQHLKGDELLVKNLNDIGKVKIEPVETSIEGELVYPLLRGRDVSKWRSESSAHIIQTQDAQTRKGIPEAVMKREQPRTFAFFKQFEEKLRKRSGYKLYFKPTDPFYSIYNVGIYTLAPYKVVWREQSREFQAAKIGLRDGKPIIPDHKLMAIECITEAEADYLTALLNSSPCNLMVMSYAVSTSTSTHVLEHVAIPEFDATSELHFRLADLSSQCHTAAESENLDVVSQLENEVDHAAAELWGITPTELVTIQDSIRSLSRSSSSESDDDE